MKPTKEPREKKRKCKCRIRGIVEIFALKGDIHYCVDSRECGRYLRRFKFCPLCGRRLA